MLNTAAVEFAAICLHSLFYGLYLLLFIACIYVLLFRRRSLSWKDRLQPMEAILLVVSIVLFSLITARWVLRFIVLLEQFTEPGSVYSSQVEDPINRLAAVNSFCMAEIIVADLTMVCRLYFIWGRSRRVIIAPLITATLSIVFAMIIVVNEASDGNVAVWITILCSLELGTNVIVTALLAYRILFIAQGVKQVGHTSIVLIITMLVESAAIFTVFLILIPASLLSQNLALTSLVLDLTSPGIGITFSLIIVRAGLGMAIENQIDSRVDHGDSGHAGR